MTDKKAMAKELEELAGRFSEGWHEGIKIDASDIMLLSQAAEALAQPEQEPVAHCKVRPLRGDESFPKVEIDWVNQPVLGPLYATPPQRKPLTDEQIQKIWDVASGTLPGWSRHIAYARAIEAAHGIKENT